MQNKQAYKEMRYPNWIARIHRRWTYQVWSLKNYTLEGKKKRERENSQLNGNYFKDLMKILNLKIYR